MSKVPIFTVSWDSEKGEGVVDECEELSYLNNTEVIDAITDAINGFYASRLKYLKKYEK